MNSRAKHFLTSLILSALILTCSASQAAIIVGNSDNRSLADDGNEQSFSYDFGMGDDRMLIAAVYARDFNPGDTVNVTKIEYGGTNFTSNLIGTAAGTNGANATVSVSMFWLAAPSTGSNTLTIQADAVNRNMSIGLLSLSNVVQSGPTNFGTSATNETTSNTNTVNLSTSAPNSLIVGAVGVRAESFTPLSGQTEVFDDPASGSNIASALGYEFISSPGSTEMEWQFSGTRGNAQVVAAFAPVPEPTPVMLLLLGLSLMGLRRRR